MPISHAFRSLFFWESAPAGCRGKLTDQMRWATGIIHPLPTLGVDGARQAFELYGRELFCGVHLFQYITSVSSKYTRFFGKFSTLP